MAKGAAMGFLALANGLVCSVAADVTSRPGTVLVRDDLIEGVHPSLETAMAAAGGAEVVVVDVAGMTVLPGLIDCHVHLFFDGGLDMVTNLSDDVGRAAERAAAHLRAGVTTVRELGAPTPAVYALRDAIAAGGHPGPRVVAAGPIVTTPGGHGSFVGELVAPGTSLADAVRRLADQGVDCVKVAVGGGVSTPGSDLYAVQFTEPALRAGVEAAHDLGLPVAAHASTPEPIRIAAAAGVDSIEHGVLIDDAALDALVHGDSVLVPTLAATNKTPESLADPRLPAYVRDGAKVTVPAHRASISRAIAAGVRMAGGTDAGSTMTGHGLAAMEAEQLVHCGLSAAGAVAALTRDAARLLGLGDKVGVLEAGRVADVIAVAGDPVRDSTALGDVRLVVKDGAIVVDRRTGPATVDSTANSEEGSR